MSWLLFPIPENFQWALVGEKLVAEKEERFWFSLCMLKCEKYLILKYTKMWNKEPLQFTNNKEYFLADWILSPEHALKDSSLLIMHSASLSFLSNHF